MTPIRYEVVVDSQGTRQVWTREMVIDEILPRVDGNEFLHIPEEKEKERIKKARPETLAKEWKWYCGTNIRLIRSRKRK